MVSILLVEGIEPTISSIVTSKPILYL